MFDLLHIKKEGGKAMTIDEQSNSLKDIFYFLASKVSFTAILFIKS